MSKALVVVDVQNDFAEGGSLPVEGGHVIARDIHTLLHDGFPYAVKVATKDWHNGNSDNDGHFGDDPDFDKSWPVHCVANGEGSDFVSPLHPLLFDSVFHKGWDKPAFSGFEAHSASHTEVDLETFLRFRGVDEIDVCGIATDYCVKATVMDALALGFKVNVISGLTVAVGSKTLALKEMEAAGATIA